MKKKNLLMCLLNVILILTTGLAGCGNNAQDNKTAVESTGSYEKLTFDNYGREVVFEAMPQKVLTFGPNSSELFLVLGLGDKIIGNSYDNHSRGALSEYAKAYAEIPELTYGDPTREAVVTSGADFIYGVDWPYGSESLDVAELKKYGINVYMDSAKTLEQIYQEITDLGKIFHIEGKATAFIVDQQARVAAVEKKVAGQKPLKVLVYDSGGNGVLTCGGTTFETLLIEKAGGKNIFDDITERQWFTANYEEILKRNPDIIIIHDYKTSLEEKIKNIKNDPTLSQLECVKNERFLSIALESVFPGDRMAYSVELFAKGFYPDLFR